MTAGGCTCALRWLWLLTLQWTAFSLLVLAPLTVLGPDIALRFLGGPAAWGAISSCLTAGVVAGQFGAGRIRPSRPLLVSAWLCPFGVAEAMALGVGAPVPVIGIAAVVSGLVMGVQFVIFQTMLQRTVPGPVLARVAAFDLIGSEIGQPAGYALAGPVGAAIGLRTVMTVGAAISVAVTLPFAFARPLRQPVDSDRAGRGRVGPASAGALGTLPVFIHDPLERGNGSGDWRERTDLVAHVPGVLAVGGIGQHGAHSFADHRGAALGRSDDAADPEGLAALGAIGLIAGDRDDDQRNALGECFFDAVEAAMGHQQRAVWQERYLRSRRLDPHVGRQRPEARGILIEPERDEQIQRLVAQRREDGLMEPGRAVEHRAQAHQHGGALREMIQPWRQLIVRPGGAAVGEEARCGREPGLRSVKAGRREAQVKVAERHVASRIGRQGRLLAQPGERRGQFAAAVERRIGCGGNGDVGQAECLRSYAAGELKGLPDDQVC